MSIGIKLAEKGWLPDSLIRVGIRRLNEATRRRYFLKVIRRPEADTKSSL